MRQSNRMRIRAKRSIGGELGLAGTLAGIALLAALPTATVWAQGAGQVGMEIFRGDANQIAALTLKSWGSGNIKSDTATNGIGNGVLRINTQGSYQGASIGFNNPFDLSAFATNKNAFLVFTVRYGEANNRGGNGFPGGFPGGRGFPGGLSGGGPGGFQGARGGGPGGFGGGNPGGFPGGQGFPGGAGGPGGRFGNTGTRRQKPAVLQNFRMVFVTTGGKELELLYPVAHAIPLSPNGSPSQDQDKQLSIPVAGIPGLTADDAKIKEIRIFGDAPTTLDLSKINVTIDMTPLRVQSLGEQVAGMKQTYLYGIHASAGVTPLKLSWDWDANDGIQEEAEGRAVRHTYYKPGEYVVTVTVSDVFNVKQPVTTTFKVHVHP